MNEAAAPLFWSSSCWGPQLVLAVFSDMHRYHQKASQAPCFQNSTLSHLTVEFLRDGCTDSADEHAAIHLTPSAGLVANKTCSLLIYRTTMHALWSQYDRAKSRAYMAC